MATTYTQTRGKQGVKIDNYYLRFNQCTCCKRYDEIKIGSHILGYKFMFYSYPEARLPKAIKEITPAILGYSDIHNILEKPEIGIYTEFGTQISEPALLSLVNSTKRLPELITSHLGEVFNMSKRQYFSDNLGFTFIMN